MAKRIPFDTPDAKAFVKVFQQLTYRYDAWKVWCDFITMTACALSIPLGCESSDSFEERSKLMLSTADQYTEKELQQLDELSRILVDALDRNSHQDFLGRLYMSLDFGSSWRGQFFTPWNVAMMMARMIAEKETEIPPDKGYISVGDLCCGAGGLLIAMAMAYSDQYKDWNYQKDLLFVGQDIDRVVALMCYIQLSLLGCAGYVIIGDSLQYPICGQDLFPTLGEGCEIWYTPMWFHPTWTLRREKRLVQLNPDAKTSEKLDDWEAV